MAPKAFQDLLGFVEQPSRYLGTEINRCLKDPAEVRLHMALAFPDVYEIGMSHFGIQILYHILNKDPRIFAERVFAPGEDLARQLLATGQPLGTLETQTPLHALDILGFSLLYELNYTNVLYLLELGKIPFLSKKRKDQDPLVIAGGPCMCNPEPVADLFDAIVVGEAETVIAKLSQAWLKWKTEGDGRRETILNLWSEIEGVYIPSFFEPVYDDLGFQRLKPRFARQASPEKVVRRAVVADLERALFPVDPVVPYGKPVHDRLRLEIARGCTRGCRFCQAGILYRPVRERSPEGLLKRIQDSLASTGYDNVSLLSLSSGDYTAIRYLMEKLMSRCEGDQVAVSLPSIRAGTLPPALMQQIRRVRKTGFTIAPEAGSQRLRDIINKNLTDKEIFETVQNAFDLGWQVIKLYFMIGLPFETEEDVRAMVDLVQRLQNPSPPQGKRKRIRGKLNVSVATFIPKPHTPFQWAAQDALEASREKFAFLKRALCRPGIQFKWQNPEVSLLEGLWARGDRRLCSLLIRAYGKGCRFDGWTDRFRFDLWTESLCDTGIDPGFYTTRARSLSEVFPWDPIDVGVTREFLLEEFKRAEKGKKTEDCRGGECQGCGVCDFEVLKPEVIAPLQGEPPSDREKESRRIFSMDTEVITYRLAYAKTGPSRYFGHLEMVKLFLQALRRAKIPVAYSRGYHPKPKVSFDDPLPVGMESEKERFDLRLTQPVSPKAMMQALNRKLPEGLEIRACFPVTAKIRNPPGKTIRYRIVLHEAVFDESALEAFQEALAFPWEQTDRKGRLKTYELKDMVRSMERISPSTIEVEMKNQPGKMLRPGPWIGAVFRLSEKALRGARITKLDDGSGDV